VASGTIAAGSLVRVGAFGDGRANGAWAVVSSHVGTVLTLLTALPGVPNAADVIYSAEIANLVELASSGAVRGLRFLLQKANLQYEAHGCFATAITIMLPIDGTLPSAEITWECSWWDYSTATFPSALSVQAFSPAMGGGAGSSFFIQDKGTATRATRTIRSFTLSIDYKVAKLIGPGGVKTNQVTVGATRLPASVTAEWVEDAPAATTTPQLETDISRTFHILLGVSTAAGSALAAYMPEAYMIEKPIQFNDGGINRIKYRVMCCADKAKTTDLPASAIRLAAA